MVSVAVPGLLSVIVCAALVVLRSWLGKTSDVGVRTACGTGGTVPVPLSDADCGEPGGAVGHRNRATKAACRERRKDH